MATTITSFVDEFDRADGSLGVNWVTPDDGYFFAHDLAIVDEAAVAPEDVDTPTGDDAGLARSVNELGNDQFVEIEVTQAAYDFQQFYLPRGVPLPRGRVGVDAVHGGVRRWDRQQLADATPRRRRLLRRNVRR